MAEPSEKLYLSSSLSYHMLIAVRSLMLFPALGWMLCMVAATTVFKFSLVRRDSNRSQLLLLGKFEYGGGPIFKVVLEC